MRIQQNTSIRFALLLSALSMVSCTVSVNADGEEIEEGGEAGAGNTDNDPEDMVEDMVEDEVEQLELTGLNAMACDELDLSDARVLSGDIRGEHQWSGVIVIDGELDVTADLVEIAAGTQIVMEEGSALNFGWLEGDTVLMAEGTAQEPIRFCGKGGTSGSWANVIIGAGMGEPSVLRNVIIENGGEGPSAALTIRGPILIDSVTVTGSASSGVFALTFGAESKDLTVTGSADSAVRLGQPAAITNFPVGGSLTGNTKDVASITFSELRPSIHFKKLDVPYLQLEDIDVYDGTIEFDPGVKYQVAATRVLSFGWLSNQPNLQLNGTEAEPIVFSGEESTPGYWKGIRVEDDALTTSVFSNVEIQDAGYDNTSALVMLAAMKLENVTLDGNARGAYIGPQGLHPDSSGLTITNTEQAPLRVEPDAMTTIPTGGSFQGNTDDWIIVQEGNYTARGTVPRLDVPFRIQGEITTRENSVLTLSAGTTFLMERDSVIEVGWLNSRATIMAIGTEEDPIVFRGVTEEAGAWTGLLIGSSVTEDSELAFVQIGNAGGANNDSASIVLRSQISVSNSRFYNSAGYGVLKSASDDTDYTSGNEFDDTVDGSQGSL